MNIEGVKVVTIGGGTGSFTLLSALKSYVNNISAIVNMVDDGGSTGVLRDEMGVLPPGDVRQCLVALSDSPKVVRDLFNFRFGEGSFEGHSFGNLFLSALEQTTGDFAQAVETASSILSIRGRVLPVTLDNVKLVWTKKDGERVEGEFEVGESNLQADGDKPELSLTPPAQLNTAAKHAITQADIVVIAPGNLYGSLAPALLVDGMGEALQKTKGLVVYVSNLVTKPGQTTGMGVVDHAREIERFIGSPVLDYVLYNNAKPSDELLKKYAQDNEFALDFDSEELTKQRFTTIGDDFVSGEIYEQNPHDTKVQRTLIRHNADLVARHLMRIYFS